jgi:hypothetical protein
MTAPAASDAHELAIERSESLERKPRLGLLAETRAARFWADESHAGAERDFRAGHPGYLTRQRAEASSETER